ncbi:hypothetical protein AKJ09_05958 [Labilithrix luteola]|uniref:Lipoprotein n=1 Tax=Labilithrix luteola TaxID=1391654 RepID=A0A0K1Q1N9_9BACT|nr:hypothetical protein [Labilithrix luteola]AKU99294.1 hypothetical protein AKJ09_05958 [Labilithrix luteola]
MLRSREGLVVGLFLLATVGCRDDTYETVSYKDPSESALADDTAPPISAYDDSLTFRNRIGIQVNNSTKRFRFEVASFRDDGERKDAAVLFPSHAAHLAAHRGAVPSVQTVGTYVKQLDDTIYAGVERAVQDGIAPTLAPKRAILSFALEQLVARRSAASDEAVVYVAAALRLGGGEANVPADLEGRVGNATASFTADAALAKPIGFYTWSDELRAIWSQDRFLQVPLATGDAACALAGAIGADPNTKARYEALVALYSRLTNPVHSSLVDRLGSDTQACLGLGPAAFLSSSRSSETDLFEQLYPGGVPANANLMQDLVDAIRNGKVDLAPKPEDGWYQHQSFALETLLVTDKSEERSKIGFTARYKKRLQEAFQTMLVQHRETHVKQTGTFDVSGPPMPTVPEFRVEPLATVYVRHARSYVFLEKALDDAYGSELLDGGHAVSSSGIEAETLRARIRRARDLFFGLYIVAAFDIGMKPKLERAGDPAPDSWDKLASAADQWLSKLASDPIASADVRVIVPIAQIDATHMRYWAVIGVRTTLASYSFIEGTSMTPPVDAEHEARVALPTEQFLEVTSSLVPPSREEYRALCDANPTAEAIQAALEKR